MLDLVDQSFRMYRFWLSNDRKMSRWRKFVKGNPFYLSMTSRCCTCPRKKLSIVLTKIHPMPSSRQLIFVFLNTFCCVSDGHVSCLFLIVALLDFEKHCTYYYSEIKEKSLRAAQHRPLPPSWIRKAAHYESNESLFDPNPCWRSWYTTFWRWSFENCVTAAFEKCLVTWQHWLWNVISFYWTDLIEWWFIQFPMSCTSRFLGVCKAQDWTGGRNFA